MFRERLNSTRRHEATPRGWEKLTGQSITSLLPATRFLFPQAEGSVMNTARGPGEEADPARPQPEDRCPPAASAPWMVAGGEVSLVSGAV